MVFLPRDGLSASAGGLHPSILAFDSLRWPPGLADFLLDRFGSYQTDYEHDNAKDSF